MIRVPAARTASNWISLTQQLLLTHSLITSRSFRHAAVSRLSVVNAEESSGSISSASSPASPKSIRKKSSFRRHAPSAARVDATAAASSIDSEIELIRHFYLLPPPIRLPRLDNMALEKQVFTVFILPPSSDPDRKAKLEYNVAYARERLAFLGDRIVNQIASEVCFVVGPTVSTMRLIYPDMTWLHDHHSTLVSDQFIAKLAARYGFARKCGMIIVAGASKDGDRVLAERFCAYMAALQLAKGRRAVRAFLSPLFYEKATAAKIDVLPVLNFGGDSAVQANQGDASRSSPDISSLSTASRSILDSSPDVPVAASTSSSGSIPFTPLRFRSIDDATEGLAAALEDQGLTNAFSISTTRVRLVIPTFRIQHRLVPSQTPDSVKRTVRIVIREAVNNGSIIVDSTLDYVPPAALLTDTAMLDGGDAETAELVEESSEMIEESTSEIVEEPLSDMAEEASSDTLDESTSEMIEESTSEAADLLIEGGQIGESKDDDAEADSAQLSPSANDDEEGDTSDDDLDVEDDIASDEEELEEDESEVEESEEGVDEELNDGSSDDVQELDPVIDEEQADEGVIEEEGEVDSLLQSAEVDEVKESDMVDIAEVAVRDDTDVSQVSSTLNDGDDGSDGDDDDGDDEDKKVEEK